MRFGLDANFGSSFGVADRLGINSSAKVSPALGPGVGNRGADSDRITDRSTFVVGLIGSIRPDIAVRWFPRERLNLTRRSEEHTSELQSLMRISYAAFCLIKKNKATT